MKERIRPVLNKNRIKFLSILLLIAISTALICSISSFTDRETGRMGITTAAPTAILYHDEGIDAYTLVFQRDATEDASYGEKVSSYTGWDTATYDSESAVPWYSNMSKITHVIINDDVSPISTQYWFYKATALKSASIGDGITSIDMHAFEGCTGLTSVDLSGVTTIGDYAFSDCSGLTEDLVISGNVTDIGAGAFRNCTGLQSLVLGDGVQSVGNNAFESCTNLTTFMFEHSTDATIEFGDTVFFVDADPGTTVITENVGVKDYDWEGDNRIPTFKLSNGALESWDVSANSDGSVIAYIFDDEENEGKYTLGIEGTGTMKDWTSSATTDFHSSTYKSKITSVTIADGVTNVGAYAFRSFSGLVNVDLGDSVKSLDDYAFYSCSKLADIDLADVETLGSNTFAYDTSLKGIVFGDYLTTIGSSAFYGCTELTGELVIPASVTTIGDSAFYSCNALTSFSVEDANTNYSSLNGVLYNEGQTTLLQYPASKDATTFTVPSTVTSIADSAFRWSKNLTSVDLNKTTHVGIGSFAYCTNLISADLGKVADIGDQGFDGCTNLSSIDLGNSVTTIGYAAFRSCSSLTMVTFPATVTTIDKWAFYYCNNLTTIAFDHAAGATINFGSQAFYVPNETETLVALGSGLSFDYDWSSDNRTVTVVNGIKYWDISAAGDGSVMAFINNASTSGYYTLTIAGDGTMKDWSSSSSSEFRSSTYKTKITSVDYIGGVANIGNYAFYGCTGLSSITIPSSVNTIGEYAFASCTGLTSAVIPDSVTTISSNAFNKCTSLSSIDLGSVETIGNRAFYTCKALTSITIPNTVTSIGDEAFYTCNTATSLSLGSSVKTIGKSAFESCSKLTSVTIPASVESIGSKAFHATMNLSSFTVNSSNAYYSASSGILYNKNKTTLIKYPQGKTSSSFTIPSTVTTIAEYAVYYENQLTKVTIPDSVTTIGQGAFMSCNSLYSVSLGKNVKTIETYAFMAAGLSSITLPDSVESIGNSAFASTDIYSVTVPDNVTSFGNGVFNSCTNLMEAVIGSGITSISTNTFSGCTSLESVVIPSSVTSIGSGAFNNCSSLTDVLYAGTEEQWNAISITSTNNTYLTSASVTYNYATLNVLSTGDGISFDSSQKTSTESVSSDQQISNDESSSDEIAPAEPTSAAEDPVSKLETNVPSEEETTGEDASSSDTDDAGSNTYLEETSAVESVPNIKAEDTDNDEVVDFPEEVSLSE